MVRNKIVPKFFISALFFTLSFTASAELHRPNRIVELGVETEAGVSNNYFSASDFLVKDVVIDLTKIAKEMPDSGFNMEFSVKENNFFNMNFSEYFRLGFSVGAEGYGNVNIGKEIFDFIGKGYSAGSSVSTTLDTYADLYATTSISIRTKIAGFGISLKPTYYVPVLYVPTTKANVKWGSEESGKITANASADYNVYSAVNLKEVLEKNDEDENSEDSDYDVLEDLQGALNNGGLDISFEIERRIFTRKLEAGVFGRIPITPGKLKYSMSRTITATFATPENGYLDVLNDEEVESDFDSGESIYGECSKKFYRPLRLGVEAAYRPFGDWFTLSPMFAIVARSPYSSDVEIFPEYSLAANMKLFNLLGLTLTTSYLNQAFINQVSFMFNFRILELDTGVGLRSGSFANSFALSGLSAYAAVKIGF